MKNIIIALLVLALVGGGIYFFTRGDSSLSDGDRETATTTPEIVEKEYDVIGTSVEEREIRAYRFGEGENTLAFVGAIHGGYEWNSALLMFELIEYFKADETRIPENVSAVVIPVANPDGLAGVVGTSEKFSITAAPQFDYADEIDIDDPVAQGRFNANGVDLNRNFDCKWQPEATWRTHTTNAGTAAFSEPETTALRDFFLEEQPEAAVFYHSASSGVYTSFCDGDPLPETVELLAAYSESSGYKRYDDYPFYEVTGDAADWLSTVGIPAISVELETHDVIEWDKNMKGIQAILALYSTAE